MADIQFIDGLGIFKPNDNAPDFVIANGTIKVEELKAWLAKQTESTVRIDIKASKAGKYYASVNDFKPKEKPQEYRAEGVSPDAGFSAPPAPEDDLPF
jgi:ribosomal protein S16